VDAREDDDGGKSDHYLYDLEVDPNEEDNVYDDETYITLRNDILQRSSTWLDKIRDPDVPDEDKKKSFWKKAGGIVPWLDDETSMEIEQLYDNPAAPNIVFFLVDDWGWNDVGWRSSYLNWTTPTIDALAGAGIKLDNYFTHALCAPSRAALMTGRYSIRLGMGEEQSGGELPLDEYTLAQELKSAGYKTYGVGKWHLGYSSNARLPTYRGFDSWYGFYNGFVDYWTKEYSGYLDLHEGYGLIDDGSNDLVTNEDEISSEVSLYPHFFPLIRRPLVHTPAPHKNNNEKVTVSHTHPSTILTHPSFLK